MKQTVEEAAKQELTSSYAIIVEGELAYQRQAMLNMFRKGAEWQAKQSPWISVEMAIPKDDSPGVVQVIHIGGRYQHYRKEAKDESNNHQTAMGQSDSPRHQRHRESHLAVS